MKKISFVTTCKGRLAHLQQSLPRLASQTDCECIVVDYDCPDGTAAWVREHFPAVKVVHVKDASGFNKPHAQNLGAAAAVLPWLCLIDADIVVDVTFASQVKPFLTPGQFLRPNPCDWGAYGSFLCSRRDFDAVEGFDEAIEGVTCMDDDLYCRLGMSGIALATFPGEWFAALPHNDETRTRFYEVKDRRLNQHINAIYCAIKHDLMRHFGGKPPEMATRRAIYAEVKRTLLGDPNVMENGAKVIVTLPPCASMPVQMGWSIQRRWEFALTRSEP